MRWLCILAIAVPAVAWGQTEAASTFGSAGTKQRAVQLEGVSVYAAYYSSGMPVGFEVPLQSSFLGPTTMIGVAATVGGSKTREESAFFWKYSPSYFASVTGSSSNSGSMNHRGTVNWSRKLASKWTLHTSANALLANLEQLYFNAGMLSSAASLSTTIDDLAAGMLTGKVTDNQLASLLTGASLHASPEQAYLYGNRMLNASANVGAAWARSQRTSLSLALTGTRSQHVNHLGTDSQTSTAVRPLALPQMTSLDAEVSWSYSLSPRTQIGIQTVATRTFSQLQRGKGYRGTFSVGRRLTRRLFVEARGGGGRISYTRDVYASPKTEQYLFGGNIGFKTTAHTFLATYDRSLGDAYGLGSGTTSSAMGAWNWRPLGSGWSVSAAGGYQNLNHPTLQHTRSWRVNAAVARTLGPHVFLSAQYVYFQLPADTRRYGLSEDEHGVVVSLTWSPSQYR